MMYLINGSVNYNSSDGTLFCTDNSIDMITLTRVTSELLLLLIQHNGHPLSRDVILSELWEKRGLSASSNNLNNYVSMLRKALAQCGCPDLITTIPKHGFLFKAEVLDIKGKNRPQRKPPERADENDKDEAEPAVLTEMSGYDTKSLSGFLNGRIKIFIMLLAVLAIIFSPMIYNYFRLQSIRTEIFSIDQCRFYLADDTTRRMDVSSMIDTIKIIVKNEKLNCDSKVSAYYYADKGKDSSGGETMTDLLSFCPYDSKAPCENYYLSKHESKDENEK